jgi:hypothetical protein
MEAVMRDRGFHKVFLCVAFCGALASAERAYAVSIPIQGNAFNESSCAGGDAGNTQATACVITGGPYGNIVGALTGTLPATGDITDFYAFHWNQTGDFMAAYADGTYDIYVALFTYVPHGTGTLLKFDDKDFVEYANLPAGNYVLGVSMLDLDPPYTIAILNINNPDFPANTFSGITDSAVPEPATLVLIGTGLAAAAARGRRPKR